jgi:hypothetical protein
MIVDEENSRILRVKLSFYGTAVWNFCSNKKLPRVGQLVNQAIKLILLE